MASNCKAIETNEKCWNEHQRQLQTWKAHKSAAFFLRAHALQAQKFSKILICLHIRKTRNPVSSTTAALMLFWQQKEHFYRWSKKISSKNGNLKDSNTHACQHSTWAHQPTEELDNFIASNIKCKRFRLLYFSSAKSNVHKKASTKQLWCSSLSRLPLLPSTRAHIRNRKLSTDPDTTCASCTSCGAQGITQPYRLLQWHWRYSELQFA